MRRCLHAFLVAVLILSLSMDAARACWFLRRGCRPVAPAWSTCGAPLVEIDACGSCESLPTAFVIAESVVSDEGVVSDVVVGPEGSSFVEDSVAVQESAAEAPVASVVVPDLRPAADAAPDVQPTSAIEEPAAPQSEPAPAPPAEPMAEESPVAKDAPTTEPPAPTTEPIADAVPVEPNLFEEADRTEEVDVPPADAAAEPAAPVDEPREPMPEPAESAVPPAAAPEADESAIPPANPLDEAERRSGEAARLWVDATGRHAVVGVLVDVRTDGRCVIDTGAGILEVRASDLRRRDRDYAAQAAERLAARGGPGLEETAGR
ncbi:MAG: hypothetical protein ACKO40_16380 [Planctomycetaceae bacterium]